MKGIRSMQARVALLASLLIMCGCGGSSSSSTLPSSPGTARVRFAEGAPDLEALIGGVPTSIGLAYLQVDGQTVASSFNYGAMTQFSFLSPGTHSMTALDDLGYRVGPFKTAALSAGKNYSLVLVGTYPKYRVITFEEPPNSNEAQISLYEASPAVPQADFGRFDASSSSGYTKLGSATLGNVVTVSIGKTASNVGGYAGKGTMPFPNGAVTPVQIDGFDTQNVLPFQNAARLSLFLFDQKSGSAVGPVVGSLDR
jgi:hypothetical protein